MNAKQTLLSFTILPNVKEPFFPLLPPFDPPHVSNQSAKYAVDIDCICNKAVFEQGEETSISVAIQNRGNKMVEGVKISVVQGYAFSKQADRVVIHDYMFQRISVLPRSTFQAKLVAKIPADVHPSILNQKLFQMHYFLIVEAIVNHNELISPVALPIIVVPVGSKPQQPAINPPLQPAPPQIIQLPPPPALSQFPPPPPPVQQGQVVMTPQGPMMLVPLSPQQSQQISYSVQPSAEKQNGLYPSLDNSLSPQNPNFMNQLHPQQHLTNHYLSATTVNQTNRSPSPTRSTKLFFLVFFFL